MVWQYLPKVHYQPRPETTRVACGQIAARVTRTQYVKDVNCKICGHKLVILGLRKSGEVPSGTRAN